MTNELYTILEHLAEIQEHINSLLFLLKEVEVNFDLSNSKSTEAILDIVIRNLSSVYDDMVKQLKRMDELLLKV